jgi:protease-4
MEDSLPGGSSESASTPPAPGAPVPPPAAAPTPASPPVLPPSSRPPNPGGPPGPTPPRRRHTWQWALAAVAFVGFALLLVLAYFVDTLGGAAVSRASAHSVASHEALREVVIEPASTRDKVAVVDIQGVITSSPMDYQGNNLVSYVEEQLERAAEDEHVKAVILKIDSPGGEVMASDEIYKLLMDFQQDHEKPVVASMGSLAASGGYYVAAPCRWIVAHDLTITGSIGVIMHSYNWRGLMDKLGVTPQVFKSGAMKDMMSPDKRESDISVEERRIVQDLVNETFERFQGVIEEGRGLAEARNEDNPGEEADHGRSLAKNWKDYADGRLLSGKEAWKLGMVDELGDFATALQRARKLAGIEDSRVVQYLRPASLGALFRLLGKSENARVTLDLGMKLPEIRSGLYFLAPHLVR